MERSFFQASILKMCPRSNAVSSDILSQRSQIAEQVEKQQQQQQQQQRQRVTANKVQSSE
ncbi:hypothetical protein E4U31_007444 [Claviceps sp. LM219 group G6]|nr:hypothetical protein E4U31_007444 [Claviceps sp. LM219 group G6]